MLLFKRANITEIHENSEEKCMTSDSVGDRGDGNEAKDSQMQENKKSKPLPSSPGVAIAISSKHGPSASSHLHRVTLRVCGPVSCGPFF